MQVQNQSAQGTVMAQGGVPTSQAQMTRPMQGQPVKQEMPVQGQGQPVATQGNPVTHKYFSLC